MRMPLGDSAGPGSGRGPGRRALLAGFTALVAACAPSVRTTPEPNLDPGRVPPGPAAAGAPAPVPPAPPKRPILPPAEAFGRGLMPLTSTNVWAYRRSHPTYDGRGVLVAILDSGVDPSVPGLGVTSTGDPKVLDLRDFSGEGRVPLAPVTPRGDTVQVGATLLAGMGRVATLNPAGPYWAGVLRERPLGPLPASDLNGNGANGDDLALVVTRASDGWVAFADTDGDGSLADERPVHDYLAARETFGWSAGGAAALGLAVNFSDSAGVPLLDLVFDTSGHGTHVSGIAAGHGLYGVPGFDGVAPGAQLLVAKIANNAHGGISVTGSILRALDYAVRFARARGFPLVVNLSFGVGNEREGAARIDVLVDSVLAAHPELAFVTSAGNDGPGLSTMGFPGSAGRAVTVGATIPPTFLAPGAGGDVVAFFSARGGELAKPDVMAPGIAYSSVPGWDIGDENKNGTSMAAPHVSGAVALLLSAARQEGRTLPAALIGHALRASARRLVGAAAADQGAGLLDVVAADRLLRRLPAVATMRARIGPTPAGAGYWIQRSPPARDTVVTIAVEGGLAGPLRLTSDRPWLAIPASVSVTPPRTTIPATIRADGLAEPGLHAGTVTGWASDTIIGPMFQAAVTVVRPTPIPDGGLVRAATLPAGANLRVFFEADTARPFRVRVATSAPGKGALAFLHEPGGQPNRSGSGLPAGHGEEAAEIETDGRDVVGGVYEAIAAAFPAEPADVELAVERAPVSFGGGRTLESRDSVAVWVQNHAATPTSGAVMLGLLGGERGVAFSQRGSSERRLPFRVPPWARRLVVDLTLPRDLWPLFTDLGLSVVDAEGQILETEPMNYATGRLALDLPPALAGRDAAVVITPGFADPAAAPLWDGDLRIRLYAESPVLVEAVGSSEFTAGPGARVTRAFRLGPSPWPLGDAFYPLGNVVIDVGGRLWGREVPLPEPVPPIMR